MPDVALSVLLLPTTALTAARARTVQSLMAQTVAVRTYESLKALPADAGPYVAMVMCGAELCATACERAVWFLETRPAVMSVSGATVSSTMAPPSIASVLQFLMVRIDELRRALATSDALTSSSAIAVAIALRQTHGRGPAWLAEPVIQASPDASVTTPIEIAARTAMQAINSDDTALIDMLPSSVPAYPLQSLMTLAAPSLTVNLAPARHLRVLALLQGFPMGGYAAFNADLLPKLAAAGCVVTTCTTEWWRTAWRLERVRETSPDIHHAHDVVPPSAIPAYVDWLISSRGIEVVLLSHSHLGFHMLPYLRARHPTVAFVDYVHTDWFEAAMYGSYATMSMRFAGQLDAQLATSDALVSQLVAGGCERSALRTAHIGIDTTMWHHAGPRLVAVRRSLGATDDTLVLLFSGRISPEKRPHLAVDVASELMREGRDVMLVFAGTGPLLQATYERAQAGGLGDRCKFLGEVDEPTLRAIYAASDVLLAPSEIEGISRSLYEAMAMGCVPVVSDVGGQRELVVPGTGSLVPADRDEAMRYAAGVRPFFDPAVRIAVSAAARARVVDLFDSTRTVGIVLNTLKLARERRRVRQDVLPPTMAEELAVQSLEMIRRHVLRAVGR